MPGRQGRHHVGAVDDARHMTRRQRIDEVDVADARRADRDDIGGLDQARRISSPGPPPGCGRKAAAACAAGPRSTARAARRRRSSDWAEHGRIPNAPCPRPQGVGSKARSAIGSFGGSAGCRPGRRASRGHPARAATRSHRPRWRAVDEDRAGGAKPARRSASASLRDSSQDPTRHAGRPGALLRPPVRAMSHPGARRTSWAAALDGRCTWGCVRIRWIPSHRPRYSSLRLLGVAGHCVWTEERQALARAGRRASSSGICGSARVESSFRRIDRKSRPTRSGGRPAVLPRMVEQAAAVQGAQMHRLKTLAAIG